MLTSKQCQPGKCSNCHTLHLATCFVTVNMCHSVKITIMRDILVAPWITLFWYESVVQRSLVCFFVWQGSHCIRVRQKTRWLWQPARSVPSYNWDVVLQNSTQDLSCNWKYTSMPLCNLVKAVRKLSVLMGWLYIDSSEIFPQISDSAFVFCVLLWTQISGFRLLLGMWFANHKRPLLARLLFNHGCAPTQQADRLHVSCSSTKA